MKRFAVILAAGAALAATPAAAQDVDNGGVFVGVVGGYDVLNTEAGGNDASDTGVFYGLTAGYDIDAGKAIIGLEAEISDTTISDDGIGGAGVDIYGGLRLGYEMDDNDIIFIKAGYTNVDLELPLNLEGIRVGAGVEHNFGTVTARLEYRYSNYNFDEVIAAGLNGNRSQIAVTLGAKF